MEILNDYEQSSVLGGGYWWLSPSGQWFYIDNDEENVLQYFKWPQNFRCERCGLLNDCCQFELLKVIKKIQIKHQEAHIDHKHFIF